VNDNERWLSLTLANLGDAVIATDERGTIVLMNPVAESLTGWTRQDALGRRADDVVRLRHRGEGEGPPHPLTVVLQEGAPHQATDLEIVTKDGRAVEIGVRVTPLRDENAETCGTAIVFRDVAERKRAEEAQAKLHHALLVAADEWRHTFDVISSPVLVLDLRGRILRMNAAAQQLAGVRYDQCLGAPVGNLGPMQPWIKAAEIVEQVRADRPLGRAQATDPTTGRTWDISSSVASGPPREATTEKEERRVIVIATDVSPLMELQASLRRSETMYAMGTLVAGVAHEARNPLFGISANLDALEARAGSGDGSQRETVQHMRQALNRLIGLMQQLLDYGKPLALELAPGSVREVIDDAVDACRPLAESLDVRLVIRMAAELPPVRMERSRLVQLFENVIENAVQHSPTGAAVTIEGESVIDDDQPWVECRVMDSGPGFGGGDMSKLFEPFYTRRRGGTGLGLSIVHRIAQEHGGRVHAKSGPEKGGLMVVRLPALSASSPAATRPRKSML
jgi:PAS domain S-box-containing protein